MKLTLRERLISLILPSYFILQITLLTWALVKHAQMVGG